MPAPEVTAPAIDVEGLVCRYGDTTVVDGVSFSVHPGELVSLLGPNGAGKSTTISVICGLLAPVAGDARILGRSVLSDPLHARAQLGIVPQDLALYEDLSARENLTFWGRMAGLSGRRLQGRVDDVLALIGLADRSKDKVDTYSGGMKRRLNIGAALVHEPRVIIMDEPTVGIDPQSRRHILDSVKALNREGQAILYTTHHMEEAEELSDRVVILDHGKLIAAGTRAELVAQIGEKTRLRFVVPEARDEVMRAWDALDEVDSVTAHDDEVVLIVDDADAVLPRAFDAVAATCARVSHVSIEPPDLEAVFLHLTGRGLRD